MTKYYFSDLDDEKCYEYAVIIEMAEDEGLDEIEMQEAKRVTGVEYFWCQHDYEVYERDGMTCGRKNCKHYRPRNGKNGICKDWSYCYEPVGKPFKVKIPCH